jgi:hypothetical protein
MQQESSAPNDSDTTSPAREVKSLVMAVQGHGADFLPFLSLTIYVSRQRSQFSSPYAQSIAGAVWV